QQLQQQQLAHTMHKEYIALVEGGFKTDSGTVDAAIARHPRDRLRMAIMDNGRAARTHWRVIERFQQQTVLALTLETGRTHQIRVHCQHMRHPIIGDPMYGVQISKPRLERQFLHAHKLGFLHPRSHEAIEFSSPLPPDLQRILDFYRMRNEHSW
ncbi:MAG: RNA pseudouridine synthase, partial [Chloroflexia bacterium]|nr:RNA pseudouridine synthase [Chloroflexia bacterium]